MNLDPKIIAGIMIAESSAISILYMIKDITDWRHILYWAASSVIVYVVTF